MDRLEFRTPIFKFIVVNFGVSIARRAKYVWEEEKLNHLAGEDPFFLPIHANPVYAFSVLPSLREN